MSTAAVFALRRHRVARRIAEARSDQLRDAVAELRAAAQPYLDAGLPDLAAPYLDEAAVFESAQRRA